MTVLFAVKVNTVLPANVIQLENSAFIGDDNSANAAVLAAASTPESPRGVA